jgi:hypothetical protein
MGTLAHENGVDVRAQDRRSGRRARVAIPMAGRQGWWRWLAAFRQNGLWQIRLPRYAVVAVMARGVWGAVDPVRSPDDILGWVSATYGDLAQPTYFTVSERLGGTLYAPVLGDLANLGKIVERTNDNEDVAKWFVVYGADEAWCVWLSCVGPFATSFHALLGSHTELLRSDFIDTSLQTGSVMAERIGEILRDHGLRVLGPDELDEPMAFNPVNDVGPVSLWRVLFSDNELW